MKLSKMSELAQRLIINSLVVPFLVALILSVAYPPFHYLFVTALAAIIAISIWEFGNFAKAKGYSFPLKTGITLSTLYTFSVFITTQKPNLIWLQLLAFMATLFTFFIYHSIYQDQAMANIAISSFGFIYIAVTLSCILNIIFLDSDRTVGILWATYLLTVTKTTDIAAFFVGRFLGKRKLAPSLSPKKTVEGAVGGLFAGSALSIALSFISSLALSLSHALWLGLLTSGIGQMGDLAESLIKRDAKVKDSSRVPGVGGLLDSVDSLLFTAPLILIFLLARQS